MVADSEVVVGVVVVVVVVVVVSLHLHNANQTLSERLSIGRSVGRSSTVWQLISAL